MRIKVSGLAKAANVVVLPASAVFYTKSMPLIWRVLGLMQDQGAIANWIRPDSQLIAQVLGVSVQSVYRAMQRLYLLGMVERRHNPRHRAHTPADYRIALEPPQ